GALGVDAVAGFHGADHGAGVVALAGLVGFLDHAAFVGGDHLVGVAPRGMLAGTLGRAVAVAVAGVLGLGALRRALGELELRQRRAGLDHVTGPAVQLLHRAGIGRR